MTTPSTYFGASLKDQFDQAITSPGGTLTWTDDKANLAAYVQATAGNQPSTTTNPSGTNDFTFDGVNDRLTTTGGFTAGPGTTQYRLLFFYFKSTGSIGSDQRLWHEQDTGTGNEFAVTINNTSGVLVVTCPGGTTITGTTVVKADNTFHTLQIVDDTVNHAFVLYLDGVQEGSTSLSDGGNDLLSGSQVKATIGADIAGATLFFQGSFGGLGYVWTGTAFGGTVPSDNDTNIRATWLTVPSGALAGTSTITFAASATPDLKGAANLSFGASALLQEPTGNAGLFFRQFPHRKITADQLVPYNTDPTRPSVVVADAELFPISLAAMSAISGQASISLATTGTATNAGAGGAMVGSSAITFAASGTSAGVGALAGSSAITVASTSTLSGKGALAGTSAVAFGSSATGSATAAASGTSAITVGSSAALAGAGALAAASAITVGSTGAVTGAGALSGTSPITVGSSAVLSCSIAGSSAITFASSATLTGKTAMVGTSAVTFASSAALTGAGALAGTTPITVGSSGAVTGAGALTGSSAVTFASSASMIAAAAISGSAAIVFAGTLANDGVIRISGSSTITFASSATALGAGVLSGTSNISIASTGALAGKTALTGSSPITFASSASLLGKLAASGTTTITIGVTGSALGAGSLSGLISVLVAGQGTLKGAGQLTGESDISLVAAAIIRGLAQLIGIPIGISFGGSAEVFNPSAAAGTSIIQFRALGNLLDGTAFRSHGGISRALPPNANNAVASDNAQAAVASTGAGIAVANTTPPKADAA